MATNKARIAKAERLHKAKTGGGMGRFAVCYAREGIVKVNGVQMDRGEWDKIKKDNDVMLVVRRASDAIKDGDA